MKLVPFPSSATPGPLYTPPRGAPPTITSAAASTQKNCCAAGILNVTNGKSKTCILSIQVPEHPPPPVKVYVMSCSAAPAAAGSKSKLIPFPLSVTPGPEYTPPAGEPAFAII